MSQPVPARAAKPKPKTLAQQQSDFTSEGSPPAGKVANAAPVTPHTADKPTTRKATPSAGRR